MPDKTTCQLPLDDNTLFILLALKYDKRIEIYGLNSVYDGLVNYDETLFKPDTRCVDIKKIAQSAIKWIRSEFNINCHNKDDIIILECDATQELDNFLNDYFSEFRTYENYYHTETEHKNCFIQYVERTFGDLVGEWNKKFTYKMTPDKQYKMIQYIGYLFHKGILQPRNDGRPTFHFNQDGDTSAKVVELKFSDEYNLEKFKLNRKDKGMFYIFENDKNVYFAKLKFIPDLKSFGKLLHYCIENDTNEVTPELFRNIRKQAKKKYKQLSDERIGKYFARLNSNLQDFTGFTNKRFLYSPHKNGKWILDLKAE